MSGAWPLILQKTFIPSHENTPGKKYGLVSQMRRAAVSISANISEGAARKSRKEFIQFLYIARASSSELDTLLEISKRTRMTEEGNIHNAKQMNLTLIKMLTALINRLTLPKDH